MGVGAHDARRLFRCQQVCAQGFCARRSPTSRYTGNACLPDANLRGCRPPTPSAPGAQVGARAPGGRQARQPRADGQARGFHSVQAVGRRQPGVAIDRQAVRDPIQHPDARVADHHGVVRLRRPRIQRSGRAHQHGQGARVARAAPPRRPGHDPHPGRSRGPAQGHPVARTRGREALRGDPARGRETRSLVPRGARRPRAPPARHHPRQADEAQPGALIRPAAHGAARCRRCGDNRAMSFHPAVSGWLAARFGQPTEAQSRAWAVTAQRRHALVAAPTGSGKTLAAFLAAIDDLVVEALERGLADAVHVLYVSPLKALSNDIRKNLQEPLVGIRAQLEALGLPDPGIRDAVRTGDTPAAERERMRREPPHILVTTPESLHILLTSASGRAMLKSVRTVIVDELHAVAGVKRGAHLALSLERLHALCVRPPVRIGLSATVKPLAAMARFLVGARADEVAIVDAGHIRERDLAIEVPRSPLTAVMANEVWAELYDRLAELIAQHRTTLVFVNQRRVAERAARHLAERLGEAHVTAHHGSLARAHRLDAEQRLKSGALKALVATSSLELGIDIGQIDLVCQLGSPRSINAFVQRVGRAGHAIGAIPKGRLFALAQGDLLECAALLDAVRRGELDRIRVPDRPLDALAQQVIAEVACRDWPLDDLYACCRLADPYRTLTLHEFEQVVQMLADGYATRRGRRGAYLHYDAVHRILRARRGARLAAVTNAGVIPDQFDYEVVLLPEATRVGTLNEDFAFESLAGDIFQLGNASYRIVKIETGKVMVEDARGQPPTMPFWLGESLGRSDELSDAVSRLAEQADTRLDDGVDACQAWLHDELQLPHAAAQQLALYLGAAKAALGALPTQARIVFERFFDEVGDTHLVIHSPYGSRINRAWGLALRKRMCRKFDFELQASALDDSIVLSLGPTHSFALGEVRS